MVGRWICLSGVCPVCECKLDLSWKTVQISWKMSQNLSFCHDLLNQYLACWYLFDCIFYIDSKYSIDNLKCWHCCFPIHFYTNTRHVNTFFKLNPNLVMKFTHFLHFLLFLWPFWWENLEISNWVILWRWTPN